MGNLDVQKTVLADFFLALAGDNQGKKIQVFFLFYFIFILVVPAP